jgi:hypothetical protein
MEFKLPTPVALAGGPDAWRLRNALPEALHDVLLVVRTQAGTRVGWLDTLAPAPTQPDKPAPKPAPPPPPAAKANAAAEAAVKRVNAPGGAPPEPKAERVAPQAAAAGGPETTLALGPPLDAAGFDKLLAELESRLARAGLAAELAKANATLVADELREGKELLVLARVDPATLERLFPLDVSPPPRKAVRTRLLAMRRLDPSAAAGVPALIAKLAADDWPTRDAAEQALYDLGPLAWEALRKAVQDPQADLETVARCEALLFRQRQPVPDAKR